MELTETTGGRPKSGPDLRQEFACKGGLKSEMQLGATRIPRQLRVEA